MTDAYSMVNYGEAIGWPILYTMNDASEWEFRLLGGNMINPEHVEFPPYPSEILDEPRAKNFMTEEEYQSYMSAYSEYLEGVADMPQIKDYMTESEYAEYTAAMNMKPTKSSCLRLAPHIRKLQKVFLCSTITWFFLRMARLQVYSMVIWIPGQV